MPKQDDPLLTRETLLVRLRDPENDASWEEFARIYTPLLYGFCINRGLSHDDTADTVQVVMRSVAQAMHGFHYDPKKGTFRSWLFTAVRNAVSAHFRKEARKPKTAAQTEFLQKIETTPDEREELDWDRDYQRRLLAWAMGEIRGSYGEHIWRAFEETALRGRDPSEVAGELGMTKNAVAVAKHRIISRLKEKAQSVDAEHWETEMIEKSAAVKP